MHESDIAVRAVVGLLALYGAAIALVQLATWGRRWLAPTCPAPSVSLLVFVRDQEHLIEGFLRTVMGETCTGHCKEVMVVDTGSSDDTPAIVERLARGFACLRLVRVAADTRPPILHPGRTAVVVDLQGPVDVHSVLICVRQLLGEDGARQHRSVAFTPNR